MSIDFNQKVRDSVSSGSRTFLGFKMVLVVLFIAFSLLFWYGNQLMLTINPDNDQEQYRFTVGTGDTWYIEFMHSVQKTPVQEYFIVRGKNDLLLEKTIYQSMVVGLPFMASEGKLNTTGDGHFVLEMHREYKTLKLRTGLEACPKIYFGGNVLPIYNLYEPGTLVEIKVIKRYETWFPD